MPVTPFHFGLGTPLKAIGRAEFSFLAFLTIQVAIDLESVWNIMTGRRPVHGVLHTFAGASALAAILVLVVVPIHRAYLRLCWRALRELPPWWLGGETVSYRASGAGAFAGVAAHVIPDAIMHADVRPFAPASDWNPFLGIISLGSLHGSLIVLGLLGIVGIARGLSDQGHR